MTTKTIVFAAMVSAASAQNPFEQLCAPIQKMAACVQPLFDEVTGDTCAVLSPYTEGLDGLNPTEMVGMFCGAGVPGGMPTGRRLLSADVEEATRVVTAVHSHSRRLAEGVTAMAGANVDFTVDDLVKLCDDKSTCLPTVFYSLTNMFPCIRGSMKEFMDVISAMGFGGMPGMDLDVIFDQLMDQVQPQMDSAADTFKQVCTSNAQGDYCITKYETFSQTSTLANGCDEALDLGCCLGTAPKIVEATGPAGATAAEASRQAMLGLCGWDALPAPCMASGETSTVAKLKFKLPAVAKSALVQLERGDLLKFKAVLKADIAAKIKQKVTSLDMGELLGDDSGVEITMEAVPAEGSTASEVAALFEGDIAFTETQKMLQTAQVVDATTTVEGSGVTAEQEQLTSPVDLEASGAAQASPALCLAAVAAALLIAH